MARVKGNVQGEEGRREVDEITQLRGRMLLQQLAVAHPYYPLPTSGVCCLDNAKRKYSSSYHGPVAARQ